MKSWKSALLIVFLCLSLSGLGIHAFASSFSRYTADDYCSAYTANELGVLSSTAFWYQTWSGRYMAHLFDAFVGTLGPSFYPYAPSIVLACWFLALWYALRKLNFPSTIAPIVSAFVILITLSTAPDIVQSLYWGQGMRALIPSFIFFSLFVGLLQVFPTTIFGMSILVLLTIFAGGFSETFAVLQVAFIVIFLGIAIYKKSRRSVILLSVSLAGAALAFFIVLIAPGNEIRAGMFVHPTLPKAVLITIESTKLFLISNLRNNYKDFAAILLFSFLVANEIQNNQKIFPIKMSLWIVPILTIALILAAFFTAAIGRSDTLPARARIIPQFVINVSALVWFYCIINLVFTRIKMSKSIAIVPVLLLAVYIGFNIFHVWERLPTYQSLAHKWDQFDRSIQIGAISDLDQVEVSIIPNPLGLKTLSPYTEDWVNQCMDQYYGTKIVFTGHPVP